MRLCLPVVAADTKVFFVVCGRMQKPTPHACLLFTGLSYERIDFTDSMVISCLNGNIELG
jgi:hypothetical protein